MVHRGISSFLQCFCHFSQIKFHVSASEDKNVKREKHVHIYVLQHHNKFQTKILIKGVMAIWNFKNCWLFLLLVVRYSRPTWKQSKLKKTLRKSLENLFLNDQKLVQNKWKSWFSQKFQTKTYFPLELICTTSWKRFLQCFTCRRTFVGSRVITEKPSSKTIISFCCTERVWRTASKICTTFMWQGSLF